MGFDWKPESKERYFRKAEKIVKSKKFGKFLHVDRSQFGIVVGKTVKVYFEPIRRTGNMKQWWDAKREIPGLDETKGVKSGYGKRETQLCIHAYIEMEMEERDR